MKDQIEFDVLLIAPEENPKSAAITCPFDVLQVFGTKARVPVRFTVDGHTFRSSLAPMGGCHMMTFNKEMRNTTGYKSGDTIHIIMERDTEPRIVEIPEDVLMLLTSNEAAYQVYQKYSYSIKKEIMDGIKNAKRPETRQKRINKLLDSLTA